MLYDAERELYRAIGSFSTVAQVSIIGNISTVGYVVDSYKSSFYGKIPSQCAALITTKHIFTLFVESWEVDLNSAGSLFKNKKIYPCKVEGLGISYPENRTFSWKDGLIDNSWNQLLEYQSYFRPGFGQTILSDLTRPFISTSVVANNLGLGTQGEINNVAFAGPFGRLMSMAFWVDPVEAEKYDKNQSKKKKKSPNEQDYQQMPEYPPYTPYVDPSGY